MLYIVMALRRQQVAQAINPAEDNNSFYFDCFCAFASLRMQRLSL